MSKKTRNERNLKFETLQLHVGQENPDPVTDSRPKTYWNKEWQLSREALQLWE